MNNGVGIAQIDSFSLIAVSDDIAEGEAGQGKPTPDLRAVGISTLEVDAEVCSDTKSFVWVSDAMSSFVVPWYRYRYSLHSSVSPLQGIRH